MDILISYDATEGTPDKHRELKSIMVSKGYMDSYNLLSTSYDLPNTTLWKTGAFTTQVGITDLNDAIANINRANPSHPPMRLTKAVCVPFASVSGVPRNG